MHCLRKLNLVVQQKSLKTLKFQVKSRFFLYNKKLPTEPSFIQNGLNGFSYEITNKNISIDIEDVFKGHERYCKNLVSTFIYYVLEGTGVFKIENNKYNVIQGDVIEIHPNTEFVYVDKMKLLLIMNPAFNKNNEIEGAYNDLYVD